MAATRTQGIVVKDNGKGFDSSSRAGSGLGLIGMRERMAAVRGRMALESKVGKGTTLTLLMRAG